jgi:hypothetical protein
MTSIASGWRPNYLQKRVKKNGRGWVRTNGLSRVKRRAAIGEMAHSAAV